MGDEKRRDAVIGSRALLTLQAREAAWSGSFARRASSERSGYLERACTSDFGCPGWGSARVGSGGLGLGVVVGGGGGYCTVQYCTINTTQAMLFVVAYLLSERTRCRDALGDVCPRCDRSTLWWWHGPADSLTMKGTNSEARRREKKKEIGI
jgi:hypothetical protein